MLSFFINTFREIIITEDNGYLLVIMIHDHGKVSCIASNVEYTMNYNILAISL